MKEKANESKIQSKVTVKIKIKNKRYHKGS